MEKLKKEKKIAKNQNQNQTNRLPLVEQERLVEFFVSPSRARLQKSYCSTKQLQRKTFINKPQQI